VLSQQQLVNTRDTSNCVTSYILGGSMQGITWKYFLFICKLFRLEYSYFDNMISEQNAQFAQLSKIPAPSGLDFEDKLVILLRENVGIPKNMDWLNSRLTAYLKARASQAVVSADSYMANHIMYRNMSFGFLILPIVVSFNLLRTRLFMLDQLALILLFLLISHLTFFRSVSFKKWNGRELLLGFYFSACNTVP
jgi:hypothetical protein